MVNAPQYEMSKWLAEQLKPVVGKYSTHTIKDTFEFCEELEDFQVDHNSSDKFMCSFDIASLFANIPLEKTLNICLDTLYRDKNVKKPRFPEKLTRKLLTRSTTDVEFSFNGDMYRQTDGVAMGSPLGPDPILANVFVGFCEDKLSADNLPLLYKRFVDDTFSIFHCKDQAEDFAEKLNRMDPALRFTVELEEDGCLPFMDVQISRKDGVFERTVYRKPTFTGIYTRWDSFCPTSQKIGLMRSLTSRARRICSMSTLPDEIQTLRTIFAENGYPGNLIERYVRMENTAGSITTKHAETNSSKFVTLQLPWIGRASTTFVSEIRGAIKNSFADVEPRVVFRTTKAFSGRHKDILPTFSRSSVIYEFMCGCGRNYVGRTNQCLSERIKQHIPEQLLKTNPNVKATSYDSGITKHLKRSKVCRNPALPTKFRIISSVARNECHLEILEALFIRARSPELCQQKAHVKNLTLV